MKKVETDGFSFEFTDAVDAFVFDEKDTSKPTFHCVPMKAVDIVAEFEKAYIFVEIKDYDEQKEFDITDDAGEDLEDRQRAFKWLKNYLKYKYRDTYLCRHAENKVDKPIHYICLVTFDNALNSRLQKALKIDLPTGKPSKRWLQNIANSCKVVNIAKWNENFPAWQVTPIVATSSATTPQP